VRQLQKKEATYKIAHRFLRYLFDSNQRRPHSDRNSRVPLV